MITRDTNGKPVPVRINLSEDKARVLEWFLGSQLGMLQEGKDDPRLAVIREIHEMLSELRRRYEY